MKFNQVIILCLFLLISVTLSLAVRHGSNRKHTERLSVEQQRLISLFNSSLNYETQAEREEREKKRN